MNEKLQNPDTRATSRTVFIANLMSFATIILFFWTFFAFRFEPKSPVKGFHSPVIALELAKTAKEFVQIAGDKGNPNRAIIQKGISADYAFIAAYWAMFVCVGVVITRGKYSCAVVLIAVIFTFYNENVVK